MQNGKKERTDQELHGASGRESSGATTGAAPNTRRADGERDPKQGLPGGAEDTGGGGKASAEDASFIALSELKPWGKNPRRNESAIQAVADSIRRFGFGSPIVARKENKEIIAGHTRYKAAKLLGLKMVPVRLMDISERDAHLLALADNKLGEIAEWDDSVGDLLSDYNFGDAMLAGFSGVELGKMADSLCAETTTVSRLSDQLSYSVIVECENESQQAELLDRFSQEGLACKPLIS